MFLEILQIQSHSPANLQPSAICKIFMIFFERPIYFLLKNPKFQLWTFWKFMLFQSHSRSKFRTLAILKKLKIFLERSICFLLKNESFQLWKFRELLLFQSYSTAILLAWDIFETVKIFFEKPSIFWKKTKFRTFWESYQFSRIPWQICYLWRFLKNWRVFLKVTSKFNRKAKNLTLNVLRFLALPVSFFGNFAGSSNFSKRQNFFSKIPSMFWKKNQISNVLRNLANSIAFSRKLATFSNL